MVTDDQTRAHRRVAAAAVIVLGAVFLFAPPAQPRRYDNDQFIYAQTVARMKQGDSYYRAASDSYKAVGGAVETTRAFRPPTAFLVWRWLPASFLWPLYVLTVAVATGLLLLPSSRVPLAVPLAVIYLIALGRVSVEYLFVELWAVPCAAASFYFVDRRRSGLGAAFALLATAVRELAAGLVVGGLVSSLVHRESWRPWAIALASGIGLYALHAMLLDPYLGAHGTEARLLGTGSIGAALEMAAFQFPAPHVVGIVLWGLAVANVVRTGRLPFLAFFVSLPLLGLVADRPYWGAMVVPFFIVWAAEEVVALVGQVSPRAGVEPA